jgi:hypothetical protein
MRRRVTKELVVKRDKTTPETFREMFVLSNVHKFVSPVGHARVVEELVVKRDKTTPETFKEMFVLSNVHTFVSPVGHARVTEELVVKRDKTTPETFREMFVLSNVHKFVSPVGHLGRDSRPYQVTDVVERVRCAERLPGARDEGFPYCFRKMQNGMHEHLGLLLVV